MSKFNRRNNNNGGKRMSLGNLAVILLCAILAGSTLLASVGFLSKGFTNTDVGTWFERELNPDNLILRENYNSNLDDELENGLKLDWKDNGEIRLSGKVDDNKVTGEQIPEPYTFTNVTVDAGAVYKLSTGNKNCATDKFGLKYEYLSADGTKVSGFVGSEAVTLDFSENTEAVTITLSVFYENDTVYFGLQSYIRPVLVKDGASVEFYK